MIAGPAAGARVLPSKSERQRRGSGMGPTSGRLRVSVFSRRWLRVLDVLRGQPYRFGYPPGARLGPLGGPDPAKVRDPGAGTECCEVAGRRRVPPERSGQVVRYSRILNRFQRGSTTRPPAPARSSPCLQASCAPARSAARPAPCSTWPMCPPALRGVKVTSASLGIDRLRLAVDPAEAEGFFDGLLVANARPALSFFA